MPGLPGRSSAVTPAEKARRHAGNDREVGDILGDHCPGANHSALADSHAREYDHVDADITPRADAHRLDHEIGADDWHVGWLAGVLRSKHPGPGAREIGRG